MRSQEQNNTNKYFRPPFGLSWGFVWFVHLAWGNVDLSSIASTTPASWPSKGHTNAQWDNQIWEETYNGDGKTPTSDGLQPTSDGLQPISDGPQPTSNGLQPNSNGLQPPTLCYRQPHSFLEMDLNLFYAQASEWSSVWHHDIRDMWTQKTLFA